MEKMTDNRLGERLKVLRKRKRYSQQYVADRIGVIRQTYSHYETGRITPPLKMLYRIAQLYEVPPALLEELLQEGVQISDYAGLSQQERCLLDYYRNMDERDKQEIYTLSRLKAQREKE